MVAAERRSSSPPRPRFGNDRRADQNGVLRRHRVCQPFGMHHVNPCASPPSVGLRRSRSDRVRLGVDKRPRRNVSRRSVGEVHYFIADVITATIAANALVAERLLETRRRWDCWETRSRPHASAAIAASMASTSIDDESVGSHGAAAEHLHGHLMVEVERHGQMISSSDRDREQGVREGHVAARGHHDAAAARNVDSVVAAKLRHRGNERRLSRAVLIPVRGGEAGGSSRDGLRWRSVRTTCPARSSRASAG